MESGKLTVQSNPFDLSNVFRTLVLSHRGAAAARGVRLELEIDPAIDQVR